MRIADNSHGSSLILNYNTILFFLTVSMHPAMVVIAEFEGKGGLGNFYGVEGINHDGEFIGFLLSDAAFDGSGMWSVRNAAGM